MSTLSPLLFLKYLVEGQASAEVTHNDALNVLDSFVQMSVKSRTTSAQPGSAINGDRYLLPSSGVTGAQWAGNDGKIAYYYGGWLFFTPREGFRLWVEDQNVMYVYDGAAWQVVWSGPDFVENRRMIQHVGNVGATTLTSIGQAAPTLVHNAIANADDALGPWIKQSTSNVSNNRASIKTPAEFRRDWLADVVFFVQVPATITNIRIMVGVFDAANAPPTSDAPTGDYATFRYSTAVDGTAFWRVGTGNNSTSTFTVTTRPIAASTSYVMRVRLLSDRVEFYVDDVLALSTTATMPTATVLLSAVQSTETLNAAIKDQYFGHVSISQK